MTQHKVKRKWFIRLRGSYLPASVAGWLTYVPYTGYLIGLYAYIASQDHSAVVSALLILPNWIAAAFVMTTIAQKKS